MKRDKEYKDGIYIGLPMDDYLADKAISSSDIKNLLQSPLLYWKNSHMNPKNQVDDDKKFADSKADGASLGTYVHDILLKQPVKYHIKPDGMKFTNKDGIAWRNNIPVSDIIVTQEMHDAAMDIVDACKFHGIDKDFEGGIAEVSIFWTVNGRRCKARVDYLRPDMAIDIKTLANQRGDDTERMIAKAIGNERYHINAVWYQHALQAAKGMSWKAHVNVHQTITTDEMKRMREILSSFWQTEGHFPYWFYFMETGGVPNIECRDLSPHTALGVKNLYYASGTQAIKHATGLYELFMNKRGENTPWYDDVHKKKLTDEDLISVQWAFK